ncbi:hypothetical protein SAMN05444158_0359 [Bradyrhizobium canariense]|uniref:Uncharacterized protein n=1 Tax=Bradyrhizobium canariense TaxID=255045 RepID=A0A1H1MVZ5_9BRAD|nr:hypothetical protein SAMN05444158_0359 [Bradyrhizobium canariense]
MGPRFIFAALIVAFGIVIALATLTTIRHVNLHTSSAVRATARS